MKGFCRWWWHKNSFCYTKLRPDNCNKAKGGHPLVDNTNSLAHTKWNCKYHIVFAPKYRRKVFFGEKKVEIGKILRQLCEWKGVKIIEAEVCPDHVHMLLENHPRWRYQASWDIWRGRVAWCSMNNFQHYNSNIGTESFGAAAIMWTQQGRMRIKSLSTSRIN